MINRTEQLSECVRCAISTAAETITVVHEARSRGLTVELFDRLDHTLATTKQGMKRMQREMITPEERQLLTPEFFDRYRDLCEAEVILHGLKPTHGLN